jgi:hypothetical protein
MKKHALFVTAAVFGLGVALAAPAFAQGRPVNDGGSVELPSGAKLDGGASKSTTTSDYYGRPANDGGPGPQPTAAQLKASNSKNKVVEKPAAAATGRNPNDGGMVQ